MKRIHAIVATGACIASCALCGLAYAAPQLPLTVDARPLLGEHAQGQVGWYGYLVQVTNPTQRVYSGTLRVLEDSGVSLVGSGRGSLVQSSFSIEAGQTAIFELPVHGYRGRSVDVALFDANGRAVGRGSASHSSSGEAILFDLSRPSRIAKGFSARAFALAPATAPSGALPTQSFAVSVPPVDGRSGGLLLPTHAATYSGATLVLAQSDGLEALSEAQLSALAGWVLAGGTLAIAVTRPEDLHGQVLPRFAGGVVQRETPTESVPLTISRWVPSENAAMGTGTAQSVSRTAAPSVGSALRTYSGGNLRPSQFGAVASYGMGEVHLLAFDPNREPFLGDGWVEFQLTELLERALERRAFVASPFGVVDPSDWRIQQVRRSLDPNVGNHWVIVTSALLLVVYALLAGPINFQLGTKAGKPLRALVRLPVLSLCTFALILGLGWASKGGRSRARHLTLVEAGAGMPRASAVRFRAFYGASADHLGISPTQRGNVIDVTDAGAELGRVVHAERDGFRIDGFDAQPWQTVVVREDGFIELGHGIALVASGSDILIKNRSGKPLAAVVVRRPDGRMFLHRRIEDQASVLASEGEALRGISSPSTPGVPTALGLSTFESKIDRIAPGLGDALESWSALTESADFWPNATPVLVAQWVGGEGELSDSGYTLDADRVVLRVVGFGGAP
jgi:hypothetical protein